jgi:fructokinase
LGSTSEDILNELNNEYPSVFYFDRVSRGVLNLVTEFKNCGTLIFFEPSSLGQSEKQFMEAIRLSDIVKYSNDRLKPEQLQFGNFTVPLEIQTLGSDGLRFRASGKEWHECKAPKIEQVIDAAGAGDWCSAGIIHVLGPMTSNVESLSINAIKKALDFGQYLGGLNCKYLGARGLMYNWDLEQKITSSFDQLSNVIARPNRLDSNGIKTIKSIIE